LIAETAGLVLLALSIRKRVKEFGGPGPAYVHSAAAEWPSGEMTLEERVGRLERWHRDLRTAVARGDTDLHNEIASRLRRLGLGDVRRDWMALLLVACGVVLALTGAILSYLA
jgi:hypothetical protein